MSSQFSGNTPVQQNVLGVVSEFRSIERCSMIFPVGRMRSRAVIEEVVPNYNVRRRFQFPEYRRKFKFLDFVRDFKLNDNPLRAVTYDATCRW